MIIMNKLETRHLHYKNGVYVLMHEKIWSFYIMHRGLIKNMKLCLEKLYLQILIPPILAGDL